jgi:hypothetical protein
MLGTMMTVFVTLSVMSGTMMTVFVTFSCDVGYNDDSICNLVTWCQVQYWQGYKYCHHCTQHYMTKLQIQSSLYMTSHDKVTNTVIIVPDITWKGYKYCHCTWYHWQGYKYCHHCTQHYMKRLQILSSLYPTLHDKVTNTVIIVPDITWQGYKYCHHCTQHHMKRSLSCNVGYNDDSICNLVSDVRFNDDCICNLVMWCWVQWWQYL